MPVKSPIQWFGGKAKYVDEILEHFPPASAYTCYVEPYGGGASILLAKERSTVEVYNDMHSDLVNFFRVLRDDFPAFERLAVTSPYSREELNACYWALKKKGIHQGTDLHRARAFYVLARQSFAGRIGQKPNISISKVRNAAMTWALAVDNLFPVHERLMGVIIENDTAIKVMDRYDSPDTMFYLDPPYVHETREASKEAYGKKYEMEDRGHRALLYYAQRLEGMVLISGYMSELYNREIPDWEHIEFEVSSSAGVTKKGEDSLEDRKRTEVLWWNDALGKYKKQLVMF